MQCNGGIITIVVYISEEPFLTLSGQRWVTGEVVANGIRKVRALEVLTWRKGLRAVAVRDHRNRLCGLKSFLGCDRIHHDSNEQPMIFSS